MARRRLVRPRAHDELKNIPYEIFIGLLSILSILNVVLWFVFYDNDQIQTVLDTMTALFTVVFLIDFLYRYFTAPSRGRYFWRKFGWADLLSSLPATQLNVLRIFRLHRVIHLFRRIGPRRILRTIVHDRANSALMLLLLAGVLVMQFGSLMVLFYESQDPRANIQTASDALWYTLVTISTVGYGDQYPVTPAGRIVGTCIIFIGVGIFGTFTGYLANFFLSPRRKKGVDAPAAAVPVSPEQVGADASHADQLRALLAQTEASAAELRRLLGEGPEADSGTQSGA
jgi:hypothetical protein